MKSLSINIEGKVQGVFFRATSKERADSLGIGGWVRNEDDGSVLIMAEGEDGSVDEFLKWCKRGPRGSKVEGVTIKEVEQQGFAGFEIR